MSGKRCCWPNCRSHLIALRWLGRVLCERCWERVCAAQGRGESSEEIRRRRRPR